MTPEALAALHARAAAPDRPWSAAEFTALCAAPGSVLLAEGPAFLLGRVAAGEAEVLMLATDPAARRRGLARGLLTAFHVEAARRGGAQAFLEVAEDNAPARALYAGAGYREAGRRPSYYARPGGAVAALLLARDLP